jgi:hypothetical protein
MKYSLTLKGVAASLQKKGTPRTREVLKKLAEQTEDPISATM